MTEPELRDKEKIILQQIQDGNDDVQKITSKTTLENHHVTKTTTSPTPSKNSKN
jgi:hypothetical protein